MFHFHGHGCRPRGGGSSVRSFTTRWDGPGSDVRGGHGRRGGGRRRMFDGGELRLVLLKLIGDQTRHGYELIRAIEDLTGGAYAPSPGVVYPTLTLLDEMGLVAEQRSDDSRKRFAITDAGRIHLVENGAQVAALMARLAQVGEQRERTDGGPVRRAMENLRHVLQNRLVTGEVSHDTLHDVAALIDDVAQKVERLR